MSEINCGVSAFPGEQGEDKNGKWNQTWDPGMTIRDCFAAKALAPLISGYIKTMACQTGAIDADHCAIMAYKHADAMLRAREGKP